MECFTDVKDWDSIGATDKLDILSNLADVFTYYALPSVSTSFATTYKNLYTMLGAFGQAVQSSQGITYGFQSAFADIVKADLDAQVSLTKTLFEQLVAGQHTYWASAAAAFAHNAPVVTAVKAALDSFAKNANTLIALDVAKLTTQSFPCPSLGFLHLASLFLFGKERGYNYRQRAG